MSSAEGDGSPPEESGEEAPAPAPEDVAAQRVLDTLSDELGDALVGSEVHGGEIWARVRADDWRRTAEVCRSLGFEYFCFLSGIDWMPHTWPNPAHIGQGASDEAEPEETEPGGDSEDPDVQSRPGWETGYAGGDTRFQVLARLHSISRKVGIILKADLDDDHPRVDSWSTVYSGADWHERETWEMFGFDFTGHPHLTHIYLPGEFEGFPLRKDFPLLAREVKPWPGIVDPEPMPEEDEAATGETEEDKEAEASA